MLPISMSKPFFKVNLNIFHVLLFVCVLYLLCYVIVVVVLFMFLFLFLSFFIFSYPSLVFFFGFVRLNTRVNRSICIVLLTIMYDYVR